MRTSVYCVVLAAGLLGGSVSAFAQEAASQPAAPQMSRVSLSMESGSAEEAFDQIARQAGIDLIVDDQSMLARADLVSLNVKDGPFWPAFIKLCQQSRVSFDQAYSNYGGLPRQRALRLYNSGNGESRYSKMPMTEAEGFVIFAQNAQRNYSLSYGQQTASMGMFQVGLLVLVDPGLSVVQVAQPVVSEAVDENGMSLMPTGNNQSHMSYSSQPNQLMQQTGMSLSYPAGAGKKIATLKGQLRATALVRSETIDIDNPLTAKQVKKQLPDYEVTISTLKSTNAADKNNRNYQLKVTFRAAKGRMTGGDASNTYWGLMQAINLTDADGKRYNNSGGSYGGTECTMQFSPPGDAGVPVKLSWSLPAETKEILVPFEMKDLLIP